MANSAIRVDKNSLPQAILRELTKFNDDALDTVDDNITKGDFISPNHQKYCKTGDLNYLTQPIVSHSTRSVIPFKSLIFKNIYALDDKPQYTTKIDIGNPEHQSFIEFNNYNGKFLVNNSIFNTITYDNTWILEQLNYVYKLSAYDVFTLKGYTYNGDVFANNYLRGSLDNKKLKGSNREYLDDISNYFPLFMQLNKLVRNVSLDTIFTIDTQKIKVQRITKIHSAILKAYASINEWFDILRVRNLKNSERYSILVPIWSYFTDTFREDVLKQYISDLTNIIYSAPLNTKHLIVYRGVRNSFYLQNSTQNIYKNVGFISTSLDIEIAKEFQRPTSPQDDVKCCIQRILLPKATHSLLMFPLSLFQYEKEVLLPHGALYKLHQKKILTSFYRNQEDASIDLCFNNIVKINVSDIVVANPQHNI